MVVTARVGLGELGAAWVVGAGEGEGVRGSRGAEGAGLAAEGAVGVWVGEAVGEGEAGRGPRGGAVQGG